ncbi:MAG: phosphatidylserine decarboxylase [Acidobacteriota bacterium]
MRVAAQATPFVVALCLMAALTAWLAGPWYAAPAALLILFTLYFFRDPERVPPPGEGLVLSPADGRVTSVERRPEGDRVSIFLSLLDCHINRSPVAGRVVEVRRTAGRFRPAWRRGAGSENERNHLVISSARGRYGVTQVAGVLARRIVCSKRPGDEVRRGERIGMIRFGSRTDLHLPPGVVTEVAVGDRVYGGLTVVGREIRAAAGAAGGTAR